MMKKVKIKTTRDEIKIKGKDKEKNKIQGTERINNDEDKGAIWGVISKILIYGLAFLLPLFFLPWTSNVLDFNKQILLNVFVFLALLSYLVKVLVSGKLKINSSLINIPVIVLSLVYGLGTIFSLSPSASFWGLPLSVSESFLTFLGFVLFYFLIGNLLVSEKKSNKKVFWFLFTIVASGFLVALFGIFQLFGKFLLPFDFARVNFFNTVGSLTSLSIFLACLLPLVIALIFVSKKITHYLLCFFGFVIFINIFLINFWVSWLVLALGSMILFVFKLASIKRNERDVQFILPMFVLAISLFFIVFKFSIPFIQTPMEVSLNQRAGFDIAKQAVLERPFLGSGPGTFVYEYSKFKPQDVNQTVFWNTKFTQGSSQIFDKLATTGVLGILALLFLFVIFIRQTLRYLKKKSIDLTDNFNWMLAVGIFSSFLAIVFSYFFYPRTFILGLLFWVLLGAFVALESEKLKERELKPAAGLSIGISMTSAFVLIFGLGLCFTEAKNYSAEVSYFNGVKDWREGNLSKSLDEIEKAINSNKGIDIYWRDLSQIYLAKLSRELEGKDLSKEEINFQTQTLIQDTIDSGRQCTDLGPKNATNWQIRGFVYRNLVNLVKGSDEWAIKSYQEASYLDPSNPYICLELGNSYLISQDEKKMIKAKREFEKAVDLKMDYIPARFQLGVLNYNEEKYDKAREQFEAVVGLNPSYSNARYFLGLIYDKQGDKDRAVAQFEKIKELNPDNDEIKKILRNLKAGKKALDGIVTSETKTEKGIPELEEQIEE